ncbi:MAG TPA: ATP-binding protein [Methylomusa anaerophila]|uniref:histidine kinase n=1 Tax=Methylomusa anaerophila TaxID=1930071 RepID=A0A348AHC5_9FIRM|nr:ATP-binding protein [Methylomusa anaerophila]BBB90473.1 sporulation kinase A [Methylomusa anaerophila]HML89884.1 ATP-binding protein [Methylomusa anaerophila]
MNLAMFCSVAGTISLIFVYWYLYAVYRERYIGLWILGWLGFALRIVLFDFGIFDWQTSLVSFIIFQTFYLGTILLFLSGTYLFCGRPFKRWWLHWAGSIFVLSIIFVLLDLPISYKLAPSAVFTGIILIHIGEIFMHNLQIKGIGSLITGYSYFLWGILTVIMPYTLTIPWLSPWCYSVTGILRLIIASGTLMIYFEKTRLDLTNKEAQYRLLAENAVDVIFRYRQLPEPQFEYISPSVLAITGYSPPEYYADAKLMRRLVESRDLPLYDDFMAHPWKYNHLPLTLRLIRKDNKIVWVEKKCFSTYDEKGNLLTTEGSIRDITARKELEQLTIRADKMNLVGEMAANMAHEIRNPLTTVRGYLQVMQGKAELSDYYTRRFNWMIEELDRTNGIICEYLLLAKDKRAERKNCGLNTIIGTLYPLIQADAAAFNVVVSLDLKPVPQLYLDENEIRQLILHLVRNGLEAMPRGGELTICTGWKNNEIILSVRDQGLGVPAHILENLGTPFLTTKNTGIGLGLPICYRIATRHNATIDVKTGNLGTTFFVYFQSNFAA